MSGFKDYLGKKQRAKNVLSPQEESYVEKIVTTTDSMINSDEPLDEIILQRLIDESFRLILNKEMEEIERNLNSAILYATDRLKDKYRDLINKSIIHGDKDEHNSGSTKDTSRKSK